MIDWSAFQTSLNVNLTPQDHTPSNRHGADGSEPSIGGGFRWIDDIIGGASTGNSLTGLDEIGDWQLSTHGNTYVGTHLEPLGQPSVVEANLSFSDFQQLFGGNFSDGVTIHGSLVFNFTEVGGSSLFTFEDGASVNGTLDGGVGFSSLDWSAYTTAIDVTISGLGDIHGFKGTSPTVTSFKNVDNVIGASSNSDVLSILLAGGVWTPVNGTYQFGSRTLFFRFETFESLLGG
jgi:hypothetical protein